MQVLLFLATGMLVGYLLQSRRKILEALSVATTWSLFVLIFLLGVSVGANHSILTSLGRLGVQALILSAGGIVGSVAVACLAARALHLERHEK